MPHVMIASKKCTGCHMCELACSAWHEGAYRPSVVPAARGGRPHHDGCAEGSTCLQTACAKCEEACPAGAIERHPIEVRAVGLEPVVGYVLKVNEDLCTNCGSCYDVCPNDVIHEHPDRARGLQVRPVRRHAAVRGLLSEPARPGRRCAAEQGREGSPLSGPWPEGCRGQASSGCRWGSSTAREPARLECEGRTVAEALADCVAREPRLKSQDLSRRRQRMGGGLRQRAQRPAGRGIGHASRRRGRDPAAAAHRRRVESSL